MWSWQRHGYLFVSFYSFRLYVEFWAMFFLPSVLGLGSVRLDRCPSFTLISVSTSFIADIPSSIYQRQPREPEKRRWWAVFTGSEFASTCYVPACFYCSARSSISRCFCLRCYMYSQLRCQAHLPLTPAATCVSGSCNPCNRYVQTRDQRTARSL